MTFCSAAAAASASAFAFARAAGVTPVTECHSCEGGGVIQTQSFPLPCSLSDPLRLVTSSHLYKAPIFGSEELESCSVEPQNLQYILSLHDMRVLDVADGFVERIERVLRNQPV